MEYLNLQKRGKCRIPIFPFCASAAVEETSCSVYTGSLRKGGEHVKVRTGPDDSYPISRVLMNREPVYCTSVSGAYAELTTSEGNTGTVTVCEKLYHKSGSTWKREGSNYVIVHGFAMPPYE